MDLKINGLSKHFGLQKAVDNISFEVRSGEIVGFLGPNGAGKTTTMKMLTQYLTPDHGEIW
ncbi:MAG TPA: ATP-binding cassette domain-containing protein, partial [Saprospiraceae bacterium]|nr:ATP-binding cassette domain-containing protein [Saprospiraceae bacterium]